MIEMLKFSNVGPSPSLSLRFGSRLNLLTGDNGLGKTFVLDAVWWVLTRTWADHRPLQPVQKNRSCSISSAVEGLSGVVTEHRTIFAPHLGDWPLSERVPPTHAVVVYVRIDGGFSVWDPARNYWRISQRYPAVHKPVADNPLPSAYQFNREQLWRGLWRTPKDEYEKNRDAIVCRGLIDDLVTWKLERNAAYDLFGKVLRALSPHPEDEPLLLDEPARLGDEPGKTPTLRMSYSEHPVPITQASAGIRRVLGLTYALVWAWTEHLEALQRRRAIKARQIVLLMDEVEAHLHPQWQRRIIPALMETLSSELLSSLKNPLQVIATTHSPLVLASMEPHFDEEKDKLFHFDLQKGGKVTVEELPWAAQGDALNWLVSESFGLKQARSIEGERAVEAAEAWLRGDKGVLPPGLDRVEKIDAELRRVLADNDRFKARWSFARNVPAKKNARKLRK